MNGFDAIRGRLERKDFLWTQMMMLLVVGGLFSWVARFHEFMDGFGHHFTYMARCFSWRASCTNVGDFQLFVCCVGLQRRRDFVFCPMSLLLSLAEARRAAGST